MIFKVSPGVVFLRHGGGRLKLHMARKNFHEGEITRAYYDHNPGRRS